MEKKFFIRYSMYASMFVFVIFFSACQKDVVENEVNEIPSSTIVDAVAAEEAFPGKTGIPTEIEFLGETINVEEIDGKYVYQGDMMFDPKDIQDPNPKSFGNTRLSRRWPKNTVVYEIDPALPNKARVYAAIDEFESRTNLYFEKRTTQTGGYVRFRPDPDGCSASVGFGGYSSVQYINLSTNCSKGNVIHEIGHVIGLWHEQQRKDRNEVIKVNYNNILPGKSSNFNHPRSFWFFLSPSENYTEDLDLNSIMMYGPCAFAKGCESTSPCVCTSDIATITKKDGSLYTAQRDALSNGDIQGINYRYSKMIYPQHQSYEGNFYKKQIWKVGDFNGTKKPTLVNLSFNESSDKLRIEKYLQITNESQLWFETSGNYTDSDQWIVGDFWGEGRDADDLIRVHNNNGVTRLDHFTASGGLMFKINLGFEGEQPIYDPEAIWKSGDFDKDGRDDIARISNQNNRVTIDVYILDKRERKYKKPERWIDQAGVFSKDDKWFAGDFDGDGKDDLAVVQNNGLANFEVYQSGFKSFERKKWGSSLGLIDNNMHWQVGDFNGDGKDDLAKSFSHLSHVAIDVFPSTGSSFDFENWIENGNEFRESGNWIAWDYDENGKSDMIEIFENPIDPGVSLFDYYASYAK